MLHTLWPPSLSPPSRMTLSCCLYRDELPHLGPELVSQRTGCLGEDAVMKDAEPWPASLTRTQKMILIATNRRWEQ
ncbi:rCG33993 [Rattus norvegicus]|uniref:RCG33993 n=1 Tax=Rattus norvegicus TaxID=10116 RepID=A6HGM8_RAT|nr:rCG33993 [Rattus norvegicus]